MVAWHPDGELLVSASYDDSIKLWRDMGDEWECSQTLSGVLTVTDASAHTHTARHVSFVEPPSQHIYACKSIQHPAEASLMRCVSVPSMSHAFAALQGLDWVTPRLCGRSHSIPRDPEWCPAATTPASRSGGTHEVRTQAQHPTKNRQSGSILCSSAQLCNCHPP